MWILTKNPINHPSSSLLVSYQLLLSSSLSLCLIVDYINIEFCVICLFWLVVVDIVVVVLFLLMVFFVFVAVDVFCCMFLCHAVYAVFDVCFRTKINQFLPL
jgi:hypothetical protein